MAVTKTTDTDQELILKVTNGDLTALKQIKSEWKFKKVEDIIRFALAVLVQSEDHSVTIKTQGKDAILSPNKELVEDPTPPNQNT